MNARGFGRAFVGLAAFTLLCGAVVGCGTSGGATGDAGAKDVAAEPELLDVLNVPTGCNPLAITSDCMLPYPSDFLTKPDPTTPTGLRLAIPANSLVVPAGATPIDMTPFNRGDGAPSSAPVLVHFGVDIAASYLANENQTASSVEANSPIAFFAEATGE